MTITAEWAKQLAFLCYGGGYDFAGMKVVNTVQYALNVIVPHSVKPFDPDASPDKFCDIDVEVIKRQARVRDPYNHEEHVFGYGPQTNTLVVFGEPKEFTLEELLDRLSEAINRIDSHAHEF